jgi:hypothetical protein
VKGAGVLETIALSRWILLRAFIVLFVAYNSAGAQTSEDRRTWSFGIDGGYSWPLGNWNSHRFAPVDQFGSGFAVRADFEFKTGEKGGVAIGGGYIRLGTSDWEDYARSRGSEITASSYVAYIGIILRPYLIRGENDHLKLDLGASVAFQSGKEQFAGWSYEYDFLKSPRLGIILGAEYDRFLTESVAITAKADVLMVLAGIEFEDGESSTLSVLPVTIGFRFFPLRTISD